MSNKKMLILAAVLLMAIIGGELLACRKPLTAASATCRDCLARQRRSIGHKRARGIREGIMGITLLIGITGALGFVALGVGVVVLRKPPPTRTASQQVHVHTGHRPQDGD